MLNEPSRAYITTKVLQRRYGRLLKWKNPVIHNIRGPFHPDVFDGFAFDLALAIKVCRETLQDLTDEEFFKRIDLRGEVSNETHTMGLNLRFPPEVFFCYVRLAGLGVPLGQRHTGMGFSFLRAKRPSLSVVAT